MARKRVQKISIGTVILLAVVAGVIAYTKRHDISRSFERATLPEPVSYDQGQHANSLPLAETINPTAKPAAINAATTSPGVLPPEINLAVPFTSQAPHANWALPYKEFCEEASALMAASYILHRTIPNADFADQKLLEIKAFEDKRFGYYEDTTAEETAVILREFYKLKDVRVVLSPTVNDMKQALAAGKLIIMPAAGRLLGNPYFTPPGPLYHMLVIKGYTADGRFITNDPGTRRGADFLYSPATLMNAMHDWLPNADITQGRKVVIIVG